MQISEEELQLLIEKIAIDHNWDLRMYKEDTLKRRIVQRMQLCGISSVRKYYQMIEENDEEYANLIDALTVNYTYWFRDEGVWEEMLKIMMIMALESKGSEVRIWSAGCSTGEEPYSIAILAHRIQKAFKQENWIPQFNIIATDINDLALAQAQSGLYRPERVNLEAEEIDAYFDKSEDGHWVKPFIREMVRFSKLDLTKDAYPGKLDLIVCRNVLIYFSKELQHQVWQNFYYNLKKDGYFINGKSEAMPIGTMNLFEIENLDQHIYRKA